MFFQTTNHPFPTRGLQVLGKLSPGRQLAGSQWLLVRYRVFLTLQHGVFFTQLALVLRTKLLNTAVLRMLGSQLGYDSLMHGITGAKMVAGLPSAQAKGHMHQFFPRLGA